MKKYISIVLAGMLALFALSACNTADRGAHAADSDTLSIVTTIFPQYDFTRQIAGDRAKVSMLLKPGAESHSYEPSPQDIKAIQGCDLFLYTGGENDVWVEDVLHSMGDQKPDTLRLIDCVPTVEEEIVEGMEHEHAHEQITESEIKDRPLTDFTGDFQSVLPYFEDGTLDGYIAEKAKEKEKSFDEMKKEFVKKRQSDYTTLSIQGSTVSFRTAAGTVSADYEYKGFRTVTDEDGEITGVWYTFQTHAAAAPGAPAYLAFSDHNTGADAHDGEHAEQEGEIAHFHLRYGNESVQALMDAEDWAPTFYAADATPEQIREAVAGHSHEHGEIDEHVWTSPKNAMEIVRRITALLCDKDPDHADHYKKNSSDYIRQLEVLDASFREVVANAARRTILFGDRFPFRYLADEYGLSYYAAFTGCSTETEASAATVAFLINKVKEEHLPVVFTIELSNGRIADSICEATGAEKMTLYSCHNITRDQLHNGATYLSMMTENVGRLRTALN